MAPTFRWAARASRTPRDAAVAAGRPAPPPGHTSPLAHAESVAPPSKSGRTIPNPQGAPRDSAYSGSVQGGPALSGAQLGGSLAGKLSRDDSSTGSTSGMRLGRLSLGAGASSRSLFFIPQSHRRWSQIRPVTPNSDDLLGLPHGGVQDGPQVNHPAHPEEPQHKRKGEHQDRHAEPPPAVVGPGPV